MAKRDLNSVISQRIEVAPGLIILRVVAVGWEMPDFVPGQYAVLGLPGSAPRCGTADPEPEPPAPDKIIARAYSIASSSRAGEYMEFYITLVHSGALTPRLFQLGIGDRLWLSPKTTGHFTLAEVPAEAHLILISTGTGLAPYMSMLRTELTSETRRKIAIIHGARHSWDLGYRSELGALELVCRNLIYLPTISRPEEEPIPWGGLAGYVQQVWRGEELIERWGGRPSPDDTHVFLCGSPGMIEEMEKLLAEDGFAEHSKRSPGQYHVEKYW